MNLITAGKKFASFLKKGGYPESTVQGYTTDVDQFLSFLIEKGIKNIGQATGNHLNQFFSQLSSQEYAPRSISHKINALRSFYDFLTEEKVVKRNIARRLKHPQVEIREPRILSEEELVVLRAVVAGDVRHTAILETLLQTGMRVGELVKLEIEDITLNPGPKFGEVRVRERKGIRQIPINNAMEKTLEDYLKIRPQGKSKNVFLTSNGRPIPQRNIRRKLEQFFKKAKIENVTVNDLRNTFIAHQLTRRLSAERVAYLVGYKNLSSINRFIQKLRDQMALEKEERIEEV